MGEKVFERVIEEWREREGEREREREREGGGKNKREF